MSDDFSLQSLISQLDRTLKSGPASSPLRHVVGSPLSHQPTASPHGKTNYFTSPAQLCQQPRLPPLLQAHTSTIDFLCLSFVFHCLAKEMSGLSSQKRKWKNCKITTFLSGNSWSMPLVGGLVGWWVGERRCGTDSTGQQVEGEVLWIIIIIIKWLNTWKPHTRACSENRRLV